MSYKTLRQPPYTRRTNRCDICGKFRRWRDLHLNFVPDTAFSSEAESYEECRKCKRERAK